MVTTTRLIQGTTFAWTEAYGATLSARDRAVEVGRDVAFAISLAVLVAGAVGFLTYAPSPDRLPAAAELHRTL
jgi:hypothetical protein